MLSYSARWYDSAVWCSKMSCDTFLSEALYDSDKALAKFVWKVCCSAAWVCVFKRWRTEQTVNRKSMFYFVILRNMSTKSIHLCLRLLCTLLHCCKPLNKYAARPWSANLHLTQPRHSSRCFLLLSSSTAFHCPCLAITSSQCVSKPVQLSS